MRTVRFSASFYPLRTVDRLATILGEQNWSTSFLGDLGFEEF
jgi:hypothetical protein